MKQTIIFITTSVLTLFAHNSNATIIYTDIADQTLQSGGSIDINFDGAEAADFNIEDVSFNGATVEPGCYFQSADHGFVMIGDFTSGGWDEIQGLAMGTTIDGTSNFANNGADGYIDPFWATNTFPTNGDQYIGTTFKIGANVHFGWIRITWDGAGTLIVKDFAFYQMVKLVSELILQLLN